MENFYHHDKCRCVPRKGVAEQGATSTLYSASRLLCGLQKEAGIGWGTHGIEPKRRSDKCLVRPQGQPTHVLQVSFIVNVKKCWGKKMCCYRVTKHECNSGLILHTEAQDADRTVCCRPASVPRSGLLESQGPSPTLPAWSPHNTWGKFHATLQGPLSHTENICTSRQVVKTYINYGKDLSQGHLHSALQSACADT